MFANCRARRRTFFQGSRRIFFRDVRFRRNRELPARFAVGKLGRSSIRYDVQFFNRNDPPELAAEGTMTVVVIKDGRPIDIPADWRAALSG